MSETVCAPMDLRRAAVVEDAWYLLDPGETRHRIPERLGYSSMGSLRKVLARWGEQELMDALQRLPIT